jgi:monoterpene epsilon-lactone hydrolase
MTLASNDARRRPNGPSGGDPDIAAFRAALAAAAGSNPSAGLGPVAEIRAGFETQHGAVPLAEGCAVDQITLGGVAAERVTPAAVEGPGVLLHLHGGGHVFASARSHRHLVSRLAAAARRTAYVTDHRLAPEAPFPAGLYLLSPWLDLTHAGAAHERRAEADPLVTTASLEDCARHYVGDRPRADPLVSPVFGDLEGFPPVMTQVGSDEVLLSDSLVFAERAALAGVGVRLEAWPEMVHAWPLFHFALPTAGLAAIDGAGDWIARRLSAG